MLTLPARTSGALTAAAAALLLVPAPKSALAQALPVAATAPFQGLGGTWSGGGHIRFRDGRTERITCRAYYVPKGAGDELGLAIRCASLSYKIEIRAALREDNGRIRGRWEERTFNAEGEVTGKAAAGNLSMSIAGGGLSGSMTITYGASSQAVSISTEGTGLKAVTISLSRS